MSELIKLGLIDDNPYNPRTYYDNNKIKDLAESIRAVGLRQVPEARKVGDRYQLAYGHRRLRAFKELVKSDPVNWSAGMPLTVEDLTDQEMFQYALHENLNRAELKPLELARSIDNYFNVFPDETESNLAKSLGMNQPTISNMRRVLKLPEIILKKVDNERINFTMARELLVLSGLTVTNVAGVVFNDAQIMQEAIDKTVQPGSVIRFDGAQPNTVEGIIKAIDKVASELFKPLQKSKPEEVIFPAPDAGCMTRCPKCLTTHPQKGISRHWCLDPECWGQKLKEYKDNLAKANQAVDEMITEAEKQPVIPIPQTDLFKNPVVLDVSPVEKTPEDIHSQILSATAPTPPPAEVVDQSNSMVNLKLRQKMKDSEVKGMREALNSTTQLDKAHMVLILMAQVNGWHVDKQAGPITPQGLIWRDIDPDNTVKNQSAENLFKKLKKLPASDLAKLITEFCLYALQYKGDLKDYTINLQELLSDLGIKIDPILPAKE